MEKVEDGASVTPTGGTQFVDSTDQVGQSGNQPGPVKKDCRHLPSGIDFLTQAKRFANRNEGIGKE